MHPTLSAPLQLAEKVVGPDPMPDRARRPSRLVGLEQDHLVHLQRIQPGRVGGADPPHVARGEDQIPLGRVKAVQLDERAGGMRHHLPRARLDRRCARRARFGHGHGPRAQEAVRGELRSQLSTSGSRKPQYQAKNEDS
jgi:hypothetical protein